MHLNSAYQIYNPKIDVIQIHKQRPLIFDEVYNEKYKKKAFQHIYSDSILNQLSFLVGDDFQSCGCQVSLKQCPKLREILRDDKKHEAKLLFDHLKHQAVQSANNATHDVGTEQNISQILYPHFKSLSVVLKLQHYGVVAQILKHAKTDYATFWIYGLYCSKFPQLHIVVKNIKEIVQRLNLDLDVESILTADGGKIRQSYDQKLHKIFKTNFISIVCIICSHQREEKMIQRLLICHYVRGRKRKELQVIKAALQMQL